MTIMNSMVKDVYDRIAAEAAKLSHYNKKSTLTSREMQASFETQTKWEEQQSEFADCGPPSSARRALEARRVWRNQGH